MAKSSYKNMLNPRRGFMIEKAQPFTKQDIELVRQILKENDEVVIGIGDAGASHDKRIVMTAGERIEVADAVLQDAGISPENYVLLPVENAPEHVQWVAEVMMVTPRWQIFYTRNFKNASMFASFQQHYGYKIKTIGQQNQDADYFELMGRWLRGDALAREELNLYLTEAALLKMKELGILNRVDVIYNRRNLIPQPQKKSNRALFLGGFQPFTGVFKLQNGHFSVVQKALTEKKQIVIAVGSAQHSHKVNDPLSAGRRIEVIRYALLQNRIPASRFFLIPIKDIQANAGYAPKVVSFCPAFDAVLAGNDWTKQLFGEGKYEIIALERTAAQGTPLSATKVRSIVTDYIQKNHIKEEPVSERTVKQIEHALGNMLDPATMKILKEIGFYDTMHFLAFAKE